jgi:hypothetical protein
MVRLLFRQQTPTEDLNVERYFPSGLDFATEGPIHCLVERIIHPDSLVSPVAQPFRAATRAGGAGLKGLRYKGAR